jgi:cyanate permease
MIPNEFWAVLPFAAASAVSPLLFTFALLVASQKQRSLLKSSLFLLGSAIAIFAIGFVIFFFLAKISPEKTFTSRDAYIDIVIGILLVGFALRQFTKPKPNKNRPSKNLTLAAALSLGFGLMLVNTSTIIMYLPAAHIASYYSNTIKVELLLMMVLFSLIPAFVPPAMLRIIRSEKTITNVKAWVTNNGRYIIAAVFGILGILEIIKALRFWY